MTKNAYDGLSYSINVSSRQVAEKTMPDAAAILRGTEPTTDVGVSVDGTWQRKRFSSTLGVVAAISIDHGKILEVAILSKSFKHSRSNVVMKFSRLLLSNFYYQTLNNVLS